MVKIILHGHFRDKIGKSEVEVDGNTVFEAIQDLSHKYHKQLKAPLDIGRWSIKIKDYDTRESLYVPIFTKELEIFPMFSTRKSKWATIAIGVALIAVGAGLGALAAGMVAGSFAATATAAVGSALTVTGTSMIIAGGIAMLFPQPETSSSVSEGTNSKYYAANQNTTAVGTRIPFGYGRFKICGQYISFNISSTRVITAS